VEEKTLDGGIKEQRLHEATGGGDDAASGGREENRGPDLGSAGGVESKILGLRSRSAPLKGKIEGYFTCSQWRCSYGPNIAVIERTEETDPFLFLDL
jgi:hypothetical protein